MATFTCQLSLNGQKDGPNVHIKTHLAEGLLVCCPKPVGIYMWVIYFGPSVSILATPPLEINPHLLARGLKPTTASL